MSNYLMKYKGTYRILPELCTNTNDFPRNEAGGIDEDCGIYIPCQYGSKIYYWGLNESRRGVLAAYIPSKSRGRNIKKEMGKQGINFFDYDESDEEAMFKFLATDIDKVATMLKAKTRGANISPFSSKNLPKNKEVTIPEESIGKYKNISCKVSKKDVLMFKKWNDDFLINVMQKSIRKKTKNKKYDIKADMKRMKLSRQVKEFIYAKGFWDDYCSYLDEKIKDYYE